MFLIESIHNKIPTMNSEVFHIVDVSLLMPKWDRDISERSLLTR